MSLELRDKNTSGEYVGESGGVVYDANERKLGVTEGLRVMEEMLLLASVLQLLFPKDTNDCEV